MPAMRVSAGYAFSVFTRIPIPSDVIGTTTTANVNVHWAAVVEADVKGRNAKAVAPLQVIGLPQPGAFKPSVTKSEKSGRLEFSGLPQRPLFPGDYVDGSLLIQSTQDLATRSTHIDLTLYSSSHVRGGWTTKRSYPVSAGAEPQTFRAGQSSRLPFRVFVPDPLPAASTSNMFFSTRWFLRGRLYRQPDGLLKPLQLLSKPDATISVEMAILRSPSHPGLVGP